MDAIIERRLPPAPPYPWDGDAERADSVPPAAAESDPPSSSSGGRQIRSLLARDGSGDGSSDADADAAVRQGRNSLLEYLLSKSGTQGAVGREGGGGAAAADRLGRGESRSGEGAGREGGPSPSPALFESILRLFPAPSAEAPADTLVRAVASSVNPADVPAEMDGVQLVLAALMFLSSPLPLLDPAGGGAETTADGTAFASSPEGGAPQSSSHGRQEVTDAFPALPFLLCTNNKNNEAGLAKRRYRRHPSIRGEWSIDDAGFRRKLQRLEAAFLTSTSEHPSRYRLCPRLGPNEERTLLLTGKVPGVKFQVASKPSGGGKGKRKSEAKDGSSMDKEREGGAKGSAPHQKVARHQ